MHIDIISLFPDMFDALHHGIPGRAHSKQAWQYHLINPRDFTHDAHHRVDDRPFGGGPGMVMQIAPLHAALAARQIQGQTKNPVILLSPQGKPVQQADITRWSKHAAVTFVCGRYEGIDERFIQKSVDEEICVSDCITSGGELPAMLLIDAICRLLPNALGNAASATQDSFQNGRLDWPHYTRPAQDADYGDVPAVLQSGDHQAIARWREKQAVIRTWQRRPDMIKITPLKDAEHKLLADKT